MEIIEIATSAGSYFGLKDLVPKLLGPSADYLGGELRELTEKGVNNVKQVFRSAERKLGPRINNQGAVPPRAFKNILNEAYFCEDLVTAEYFGGVLASSRTNNHRDDRGAYFASILSSLSSYQIRSHYVIYHCFRHVFNGKRLPFNHMELREQASIFIPMANYAKAMDCMPYEGLTPYVDHACVGLIKEQLLSDYFAHGISKFFRLVPDSGLEDKQESGLVVAPTRLGLELFLWSYGLGHLPVHQAFFNDTDLEPIEEVSLAFNEVRATSATKKWGSEDDPAPI